MPLLLTVSCFSKIQIGFTFRVLAHPASPRKRAIKRVYVQHMCVYGGVFMIMFWQICGVGIWWCLTECRKTCKPTSPSQPRDKFCLLCLNNSPRAPEFGIGLHICKWSMKHHHILQHHMYYFRSFSASKFYFYASWLSSKLLCTQPGPLCPIKMTCMVATSPHVSRQEVSQYLCCPSVDGCEKD